MDRNEYNEMFDDAAANAFNGITDGESVETNLKVFEACSNLKRQSIKDEEEEKTKKRDIWIERGIKIGIACLALVPPVLIFIDNRKKAHEEELRFDKQIEYAQNTLRACAVLQETGIMPAIKDTTVVKNMYDGITKK